MTNASPAEDLASFLKEHVERTMAAYRVHPALILQDARFEDGLVTGGYGHRQIFELIQNGADAIQEANHEGRIHVILTDTSLYCANEGAPITAGGLRALMMAYMSEKAGDEIGRFGLGFKSTLGVCDHPEVFSRTITFRCNPPDLAEQMRAIAETDRLPKMRTAALLDRDKECAGDSCLCELLTWATTVVRLDLLPGVASRLTEDLKLFPAEMLIFSPHVRRLDLEARFEGLHRTLRVDPSSDGICVSDGEESTAWKVFRTSIETAQISEPDRDDMDSSLRRRRSLPLIWAVPTKSGDRRHGRLWAFFPTQDETTLQGIINAPWKTDPDREHLSPGAFNTYMLKCAVSLVAASLPKLLTSA